MMIVIAIIEIEYSICLYIEFDDINRIAFKISKIFRRVNKRMKTKKQKGSSSSSKKQNKPCDTMPPLGKQFQLLYRTCDKLPSSQQYQSVFFMKRKKISGQDQTTVQEKKAKKKKQVIKKKKIEEKVKIDEIGQVSYKKSQSLCATKSTMPSTLGLFKKSSFADTFKQRINLDKSTIKKVNNLSNSNSSRYLTSKYPQKQRSPNKKLSGCSSNKKPTKSPSKPTIAIPQTKTSEQSIKSVKKSKSTKKRISEKYSIAQSVNNKKNKNKKYQNADNDNQNQYVFIDGEYVAVENPVSQALTDKMILFYGIGVQDSKNRDHSSMNQFIEGFGKSSVIQDRKLSSVHIRDSKKQICFTEQSLTESEKYIAQKQVLQKIVLIQRWWRSLLTQKTLQQCNNKKHFASKVESQKSLSQRLQQDHPSHSSQQHTDQYQSQQSSQKQAQYEEEISSKKSLKQFIEMREQLILNHMESQKNILNKMLELKKIDADKYTESLMEVQASFQIQMREINKLKEKVLAQSQRMEELKVKLRQKSQIMQKLSQIPTNIILQHFIQKPPKPQQQPQPSQSQPSNQCHRQKSNGYHYSQLSDQSANDTRAISYRKTHTNTQNSTKSPVSNENQNENQNQNQNADKEQFQPSDQDVDEDNEDEDGPSTDADKLSALFQGFADHQFAQTEIEKRYASQLGVGFQNTGGNRSCISTSVLSIHSFITNFLKFYEYFYKDEFLKLINLPYGYNQKTRMKILSNYTLQKWLKDNPIANQDQQIFFRIQQIIGEQILDDFHEHNYQLPENIDQNIKTMIQYQKIHQKAVIHCFNQCLNCFRPYYFINGAPYIWNYSEKALTFYYIAEENIQEVFQKTQYKVLKTASSLCGTIVDSLMTKPQISSSMKLEDKLGKYRESVNVLLMENREEKLNKVEKQEIQEFNFKWEYFQEDKTAVLFKLVLEVFRYQPLGDSLEYAETAGTRTQSSIGSEKQSQEQIRSQKDTINKEESSSERQQQSLENIEAAAESKCESRSNQNRLRQSEQVESQEKIQPLQFEKNEHEDENEQSQQNNYQYQEQSHEELDNMYLATQNSQRNKRYAQCHEQSDFHQEGGYDQQGQHEEDEHGESEGEEEEGQECQESEEEEGEQGNEQGEQSQQQQK